MSRLRRRRETFDTSLMVDEKIALAKDATKVM